MGSAQAKSSVNDKSGSVELILDGTELLLPQGFTRDTVPEKFEKHIDVEMWKRVVREFEETFSKAILYVQMQSPTGNPKEEDAHYLLEILRESYGSDFSFYYKAHHRGKNWVHKLLVIKRSGKKAPIDAGPEQSSSASDRSHYSSKWSNSSSSLLLEEL